MHTIVIVTMAVCIICCESIGIERSLFENKINMIPKLSEYVIEKNPFVLGRSTPMLPLRKNTIGTAK